MKDKRDILLQFCSNPDAALNALHQEGWQIIPKAASEPVPLSVRLALKILLNHIEVSPSWKNCKATVQQWLDNL